MGYYLDFVFEPGTVTDPEFLASRFCQEGAIRVDEEMLAPDIATRFIELFWEEIGYPITVFRKESSNPKGAWAYVRFSWATDSGNLLRILEKVIDLSARLGFRVYDGQLDDYLTSENLDRAVEDFEKGSRLVRGAFGKVVSRPGRRK